MRDMAMPAAKRERALELTEIRMKGGDEGDTDETVSRVLHHAEASTRPGPRCVYAHLCSVGSDYWT